MADLAFDVVEQILVRLDVEDLIRCKSVCKSWQSLISCSRFVKSHLNHFYKSDRDNPELGHRRIGMGIIVFADLPGYSLFGVAGSCNGLVCVSPPGVDLAVINPLTREERILPTPRSRLHKRRMVMLVSCGFGYDSSADDYKVIAGFQNYYCIQRLTVYHVFSLRSNTWKLIRETNYGCTYNKYGVFCGGALYWFTSVAKKTVIISFDLTTEEFKEIPQPAEYEYEYDVKGKRKHVLGVIEECLCIYSSCPPLSSKTWVMKNNKWELYNDRCETKYDVAHCVERSEKTTSYVYRVDDGKKVTSAEHYMHTTIFVKSLVSPHCNSNNNHKGQKRNHNYEEQKTNVKGQEGNESVKSGRAKGNIRKWKRSK